MNGLEKNLLKSALLAVALCALPALAGPDTYGLGTGTTPLAVNVANTVINSYAQVTAPAVPGDTTLVVNSTTGFAAGNLVLVMQMTGIVPEPPTGGPSPVELTNDPVGRWELARLTGVTGTMMTLDVPLVYSYAGNVTQVILVREHTTVSITTPGSITAPAWDGSTGGVVAFMATGTLTLGAFPSVNVTGKGFRGGQVVNDVSGTLTCSGGDELAQAGAQKGEGIAFTRYGTMQTGLGRVANGGGGGVCLNSGGGGGGNGGMGGRGGNSDLATDGNRAVGGQGGAALSYDGLNHLVMGGGGGAGHSANSTGGAGGAGGGIIFVRANATNLVGQMTANGAPGGNSTGQDAAGGGGGGGSMYLRVAGASTCGSLQVIGGNGGSANSGLDVGPGGSGGGGRILFQKGSGTCTPAISSINPGNAGVQADSSAPGGASYGAQAGTSGSWAMVPNGFPATPFPVPVVTTPGDGSRTNNNTPPYTGTLPATPVAPAGSEVAIYVDGVEVTRVTPTGTTWAFTPTVALSEGSHTIHAIVVNTAQAVQGLKSNTNTFIVDSVAPLAPVVSTPANNSQTNDSTPTYTGTAEANSTVTVYVDGTALGTTTTADASGSWSLTQPTALSDASHTVRATATDATGNTSPDSNTNTFIVDTTPPAAPVVLTPASGSATNDNTPTYTGTADANSTVTVYLDGTVLGTTTADASGNWSFTQPTALLDGSYAVKATAMDAAGNTSVDSNTNTFLVDTVSPPAPVVFTPPDGSITNNNRPVYTGGAAGAVSVRVFVDGVEVGITVVTGGSWSFTQPTALPDGQHTVRVISMDGAGNTSPDSNTNTFIVDTAAPLAPVVLTPANGSATNDNTPTYTGTAEANSTVTVYVDGSQVGTTTADASGSWSFTQPTALPEGAHAVKATATDIASNVSPDSSTNNFTVDLTAPAAPMVTTPANGAILGQNTPTYTGTAEAGSTVTVIVDGTALGTTTANASGNWTFTSTAGLSNGQHMVKATATDAAGNVSPESNTNTFTVNATIPAAPVVTGPTDGTVTNDNTPTFTGTAEPGSTVTVILNGNPAGTTTADAAGNWTFTPTTSLADGSYMLTATATNDAGNVSPPSTPVLHFVVDTAVPDTTIVSGPSGDTEDSDATFDFSSSEAGATYECSLDGGTYAACTDPVTFEGLAEGGHTLSVRARDSAGNVDPTPATATWNVVKSSPEGLNFRGGGVGCASTGGDPSALAMMGLAVLSALMARKRRS